MRCRRSKGIESKKFHHSKKCAVIKQTVNYTKNTLDEDSSRLHEISLVINKILYHDEDIEYDEANGFLTLLESIKTRKLSDYNLKRCEKLINQFKYITEVIINELKFSNMTLYDTKDKTQNKDVAKSNSQETYCSELENLNFFEKEAILSHSIHITNEIDNCALEQLGSNSIDLKTNDIVESNEDITNAVVNYNIFPTINLISQNNNKTCVITKNISDKDNNINTANNTSLNKSTKIDNNHTTEAPIVSNFNHFREFKTFPKTNILGKNKSQNLNNNKNMNVSTDISKKVANEVNNFGRTSNVKEVNVDKTIQIPISINTENLQKYDKQINVKSKNKRNKILEQDWNFTLHFNNTPEDNFDSPHSEQFYKNTNNDLDAIHVPQNETHSDLGFEDFSQNNVLANKTINSTDNTNNFIEEIKTKNIFKYTKTLPIEENIKNFKEIIVEKLLQLRDTVAYNSRANCSSQQSDISTKRNKSLFQTRDQNMTVQKDETKKSDKTKRAEQIYQEIEDFVKQRKMDK